MSAFGPELPAYATLVPGVRRIVAPNPGMMTGPGTNTYLLGRNEIAVLDPGPRIDRHVEEIVVRAEAPIRWILVTHTHPDHSPGAAKLQQKTGAELLGMAPPDGEHQDQTFSPDTALGDGDVFETREFRLHVVHTPGHASNHLCYHHPGLNWVFTGDHVIDGSTVVINPPDGNMTDYLRSLERLREIRCGAIAPGHGDLIRDPDRVVAWTIEHRLEREARVLAAVRNNPDLTPMDLVQRVYTDVDEHLHRVAERSLLAHLLKLGADGIAECRGGRWRIAEPHATSE